MKSSSAYPSNQWRRRSTNETEAAASDRTQRLGNLGLGNLGTTGYGNTLSGYGGYSGVGSYSKPSIDIGGVVLGTLIGIGALLILPKIVGVFSGHGGYYRSELSFKSSEGTKNNCISFLLQLLMKLESLI